MTEARADSPSDIAEERTDPLSATGGLGGWWNGILAVAALAFAGLMAVAKSREFPLPDVALSGTSGLLFVLAGIVARVRRPDNRVGALMVVTGFAWFAEDLQLVPNSALFTLGRLLSGASLPAAVYLILAFPSGRLSIRWERTVFAGALMHGFGFSLAITLFQPRQFASCQCRNLIAVHPDGGVVHNLVQAAGAIGLVLAIAVVALLARRWAKATPPMRRVLAPVLLVGLVGAVASAADGVARAGLDHYPSSGIHDWVMIVVRLTFWALPVAFLAGVLRFRLGRTGVGGLLLELRRSRSTSELHDALARALGDPSVEIAYVDPTSGELIDAGGAPRCLPAPGSSQAWVHLERDGRPIGALIHDVALLDDADMVAAVASVAALALDNERLAAEVQSQLHEVQCSRSRILEAADAERRRVERDLHDGAQQRLVTLALRLRMARRRLTSATDPVFGQLLQESVAELDEAMRQLRELARGIHPAVLTDSGLAAALQCLAEQSPMPVRLTAMPTRRLSPAVEIAAYYVVAEALTNVAKHARASAVTVQVTHEDTFLELEIADNGVGGADPALGSGLVGLRDRVATLGGRLEVLSEVGGGTRVRSTIPCP